MLSDPNNSDSEINVNNKIFYQNVLINTIMLYAKITLLL